MKSENDNQYNKNINKDREIIKKKQNNSGHKNIISELKNIPERYNYLPKHSKERIIKF